MNDTWSCAGPAAGAGATATPTSKVASLNGAALSGLGLKSLPPKPKPVAVMSKAANGAANAMDDFTETKRKLLKLSDMPEVDLTLKEDARVGDLEADDDEDEDIVPMDVDKPVAEDDEEFDPLDAFMSGVSEAVKKVDADDRKKIGISRAALANAEDEEDGDDVPDEDELASTGLNPEDILALAAKKAKKKDIAAIDHSKINYDPFRKAFYHPPPDIAEMTEDEAEALRLELDGIKIRGVDCPKPIIKWSHCGLPASW